MGLWVGGLRRTSCLLFFPCLFPYFVLFSVAKGVMHPGAESFFESSVYHSCEAYAGKSEQQESSYKDRNIH